MAAPPVIPVAPAVNKERRSWEGELVRNKGGLSATEIRDIMQQKHDAMQHASTQEALKTQYEHVDATQEKTEQTRIEKEATPAHFVEKGAVRAHELTKMRAQEDERRREKREERITKTLELARDRRWHRVDEDRERMRTAVLAGVTAVGVGALGTALAVGIVPSLIAAGTVLAAPAVATAAAGVVGASILSGAGVGAASRIFPSMSRETATGG